MSDEPVAEEVVMYAWLTPEGNIIELTREEYVAVASYEALVGEAGVA